MPHPLVAAFLLLGALLFPCKEASASRSDGHFPPQENAPPARWTVLFPQSQRSNLHEQAASRSLTSHDVAGRLLEDAFWFYTWDDAGRLLCQTRKWGTFAVAGTLGETLAFGYDADGRRNRITHTRVDAKGHARIGRSYVLWAGWHPIMEDRSRAVDDAIELLPRRWFQWGADVDGAFGGAGGIGGLVAIHEEGARTLLPMQDGLGNICAVINAASGETVARYAFGPFGEPLGESGEADACPFRWQTKWYEPVSQQYYFGYRHYDPRLGRWLSRDPLGEEGGVNLYAYCGNDPVNRHDPLGLAITWINPENGVPVVILESADIERRDDIERAPSTLDALVNNHKIWLNQRGLLGDFLRDQRERGNPGVLAGAIEEAAKRMDGTGRFTCGQLAAAVKLAKLREASREKAQANAEPARTTAANKFFGSYPNVLGLAYSTAGAECLNITLLLTP